MQRNTISPEVLAGAVRLLRPYYPELSAEKLINSLKIATEPQPEQKEKYLSKQEAASLLHISVMTIHRMLKEGSFPKLKASKRLVRIPESAVLNYLRGEA